MRFRKDARLDPSQVEDYRGRGGRVPGGIPVTLGGGGGLVAIVVVLAFILLSGGGGLGDLGSLAGQTVGPSPPPPLKSRNARTTTAATRPPPPPTVTGIPPGIRPPRPR